MKHYVICLILLAGSTGLHAQEELELVEFEQMRVEEYTCMRPDGSQKRVAAWK
ncbi:MAG: hypothetical protein M3R08_06885 [Bacteroidota bacterium]|nr:hypothetical protein [Bacteroidota bacterium]